MKSKNQLLKEAKILETKLANVQNQIAQHEMLRMQMLAGVITESQYKEKMDEAEEGVNLDKVASDLAREFGVNPNEVEKSMDLIDEVKLDEDYLTSTAEGPEVIAGAIALAGGIIGAVVGYIKWERNVNLRNYVEEEARILVNKELKAKGLDPKEVDEKDMKVLVKAVVTDLRKDPEFIKMAKVESQR
jgi:hypothetical protein